MNNDLENHMVLPVADPEDEPELVEQDIDAVHDMIAQHWIDADNEERKALLLHLGLAINHIATHASFDQLALIQLLKRTRKYLDER